MNKQTTEAIIAGFSTLGVAPALLSALERMQHVTPTPIQAQTIPIAISGKDVVGIAQTGTGKTIAFGIPMIQRLAEVAGQGLVVLPTRELALQVDEVFRRVADRINLRTVVLIGGTSFEPQRRALMRKPHIIIATPGRLIDHLEQKTVRLDQVRIVVLDEADHMFDMGFAPQIRRIMVALPKERQTMLFSATMPPAIMQIASAHMKLPVRIEIAPAGTTAERVTQEMFIIRKEAKNRLLDKLLQQYPGTTLIFSRTKHGAKRLARTVRAMGVTAAELHSNRSLAQRREAVDGFKRGKYRVLVATDIAARGIDVVGIVLVVNYDLPDNSEDYVHRIGRTARAGAGGRAISFVTPEQRGEVYAIERLIRKSLPVSPLPELPPERPALPYVEEDRDFSRPRYGGNRNDRRPRSGGFQQRGYRR